MKKRLRFVGIAIAGIAAIGLFGFIVMGLWNWLLPEVFGARTVTYWQALGILVLSKILFGSFRGGGSGGNRHWKRRMQHRWNAMTPEERERFCRGMEAGGREPEQA